MFQMSVVLEFVLKHIDKAPSFENKCKYSCLACLRVIRAYVPTCSRAFVPLLRTCFHFLRALSAFIVLSTFSILRAFSSLHALRAFTFYVPQLPSFLQVSYVPPFFMSSFFLCLHFLRADFLCMFMLIKLTQINELKYVCSSLRLLNSAWPRFLKSDTWSKNIGRGFADQS